jgi:hypothetical protein
LKGGDELILELDEIIKKLSDRNLREVSRRTGLSYATIIKVSKRESVPLYPTLKILSDYLKGSNDNI